MQNQKIMFMTPPKVELIELQNLFFQLCTKTCNLKCKHCYIERNPYKNEEDFINLDKIKQALMHVKGKKLNSIYLTGGEPLMHPDFNQILRMCLKISNTTVMSNGVMINDKKARFLRKIDDESQFETIYRISLDSTNEIENDNLRGRGSFRKALCAIMSLIKYDFNPIISVVNYKNLSKEEIYEDFRDFFFKKGFELESINLKIIPFFSKTDETMQIEMVENIQIEKLDCYNSRVVSQNGIYSCPMLVNDYRARLGSALNNCSKINYLDCEKCSICTQTNQKVQVNDWM
ncbi:MAG: radical SAM protein [Candidatus Gastranaerophilales bacterium]|nr:radical SAM protein [Candidatus Gastranaerophilales bacterium]